jgi:hypothetical protein
MRGLLVGVAGIVLFTWVTVAVQQQVKKIDDKAMKDAVKGTDWLGYGMGWSEQRYSTMTQITPQNVKNLALDWSIEIGPAEMLRRRIRFSNGILYASPTGASPSPSMRNPQGNLALRSQVDAAMKQAPEPGSLHQQPRHRVVRRQSAFARHRRTNDGPRRRNRKAALGELGNLNPSPAMWFPLTPSPWRLASQKAKSSSAVPAENFLHFTRLRFRHSMNTGKEMPEVLRHARRSFEAFEQISRAAARHGPVIVETGGGGSMWDGMIPMKPLVRRNRQWNSLVSGRTQRWQASGASGQSLHRLHSRHQRRHRSVEVALPVHTG